MSKKSIIYLVCILVLIILVSGCGQKENGAQPGQTGQEQSQQKIELRFVSPWPEHAAEHIGFWLFVDEIEKRLGDRLAIKYLGSTEIIGFFEQYEMLGKGAFEIGHLPGNMAENFLPIAHTLHLSQLKPWEERENGVYDILRQEFEAKMNLVYLGKTAGEGWKYCLYTNFEVDSLDDFKGKTFRVAPVYVAFLEGLGAGSVALGGGEIYTAMERGVVDGFGWTPLGPMDYGWYEVTKYRIDPGFYPVGVGIFINKDAFYGLPEDIQRELEEIAKYIEKESYDVMGEAVIKETEAIIDKGMKVIKLSPEIAGEYLEKAYDLGWEAVIKADPVLGPKLKELTSLN